MRAVDIIVKKRNGSDLGSDEIAFLVEQYTGGHIPDYQISAFLMAVYFQGMTFDESAALTRSMLASGSVLDLSSLPGAKIDKHSTGGVGDKISLLLAPLVAACGVKVPMLCGRALGHTGGTIDKLEAVPGYRTSLDEPEIRRVLEETGFVFMGQTERIAPADRLLYALRDVTGTVESVPLITASILSKKAAEGSDGFVFDVKAGRGAFMKSEEEALTLARSLVRTAALLGKKARAVITAMDEPLGRMVGNLCEIKETVECLSGRLPADIEEVTYTLGAHMLMLADNGLKKEEGKARCRRALENGDALALFLKNIAAQGGDAAAVAQPDTIRLAPQETTITASSAGWVSEVDAFRIGHAAVLLGAGRARRDSVIVPGAGIELLKKTGDRVERGQELCRLYADTTTNMTEAAEEVRGAYDIADKAVPQHGWILRELDD